MFHQESSNYIIEEKSANKPIYKIHWFLAMPTDTKLLILLLELH